MVFVGMDVEVIDWEFLVFVKLCQGVGSCGVCFVFDWDVLFVLFMDEGFIVQDFFLGEEYLVDVIVDVMGNVVVVVLCMRVWVDLGVVIVGCMFCDYEFEEIVVLIVRVIGFVGVVNVQLWCDWVGCVVLFEVNLWFFGVFLLIIVVGVDIFLFVVDLFLGCEIFVSVLFCEVVFV